MSENTLPERYAKSILGKDMQRILDDMSARGIKVDWSNGHPIDEHGFDLSVRFLYPTIMENYQPPKVNV